MASNAVNAAARANGVLGDASNLTGQYLNLKEKAQLIPPQKALNAMQRLDSRLDKLQEQAATGHIDPQFKENVLRDIADIKPQFQRRGGMSSCMDASYRSLAALTTALRDLPKSGNFNRSEVPLKALAQTADTDIELVRGMVKQKIREAYLEAKQVSAGQTCGNLSRNYTR